MANNCHFLIFKIEQMGKQGTEDNLQNKDKNIFFPFFGNEIPYIDVRCRIFLKILNIYFNKILQTKITISAQPYHDKINEATVQTIPTA